MACPHPRSCSPLPSWPGPGTSVRSGIRDEYGFVLAGRELGHLHDDRVAHFGFPRELGLALRDAGRVEPHPVNPHSPKMAAHPLTRAGDVERVLELLRLNHDRLVDGADLEVEVRALVRALDRAQDDAEAFAALVTEDVRVTDVAGRRVHGRAALQDAMAEALAGELAAVRTRAEVHDVAFPAPDLALVTATKHIEDGRRDPSAPAAGAYGITCVRTAAGWRVAALQTTPVALQAA